MLAVAQEVREPAEGSLIAHGFGCLRYCSNPKAGLPRRMTAPQSFLLGHFEVEAELVLKVAVELAAKRSTGYVRSAESSGASTPVGPPPTTTICSRRLISSGD